MQPFSEFLTHYQKTHTLNNHQLAALLETTPATLHRWKHAETKPSNLTIEGAISRLESIQDELIQILPKPFQPITPLVHNLLNTFPQAKYWDIAHEPADYSWKWDAEDQFPSPHFKLLPKQHTHLRVLSADVPDIANHHWRSFSNQGPWSLKHVRFHVIDEEQPFGKGALLSIHHDAPWGYLDKIPSPFILIPIFEDSENILFGRSGAQKHANACHYGECTICHPRQNTPLDSRKQSATTAKR